MGKAKPAVVSGMLTIRAMSNDPDGMVLSDPDAFDEEVAGPACVTAESTLCSSIVVSGCPNFLSRRSKHGTDEYRVHEVRAAYRIKVTLAGKATAKEAAQDLALFSMWRVKGMNPVAFTVMLCADGHDVAMAGDELGDGKEAGNGRA